MCWKAGSGGWLLSYKLSSASAPQGEEGSSPPCDTLYSLSQEKASVSSPSDEIE